jgi:hypothetical protein
MGMSVSQLQSEVAATKPGGAVVAPSVRLPEPAPVAAPVQQAVAKAAMDEKLNPDEEGLLEFVVLLLLVIQALKGGGLSGFKLG